MSEQLKQEFEADIDRLEAGTTIDGEIIGNQEKGPAEGKIEDQEGNETNEADVVQMGKASLADIVSEIPAPTEAEIKAAEAENAKPVKQKAREKLEAEKKKASQKNFADQVIAYLLKRCEEDQGLAEDVIQDGKTWDKCFKYASRTWSNSSDWIKNTLRRRTLLMQSWKRSRKFRKTSKNGCQKR